MTTEDPKYRHKPSEKHTLEEVLKSLQDLIRNDLLDKDQPPTEKSGSAPNAGEAKPTREHTAPVREDFAPVNPASGPVDLDAVMRSLKDLVSNELNVSSEPAAAEESPPSRAEDHVVTEAFVDEFAALDEELTTAEPASPALTEDHDTPVNLEDKFEPLDEELTFEESIEIVPPPPTEPGAPEIPGEISAELLSEPEADVAPTAVEPEAPEIVPPPPTAPRPPEIPGEISAELLSEPEADVTSSAQPPGPELEANLAPGTQQKLQLDETPPPLIETELSTAGLAPIPEIEPGTGTEGIALETTTDTAAQELPDTSGNALPTIDVEESFDDTAYFEAEAKQAETLLTDNHETQEIILSALGASLEPETPPPANGEAHQPAENIANTPEPDSGKPENKLELTDESATDNFLSMPSVDFDAIEFEPPRETPPQVSQTTETPVPADESSPVTTEATIAQELTLEPEPGAMPPPSTETKSDDTPDAETIPEAAATPPATGETHAPAAPTQPDIPETPDTINLDDIPVLHEVVAPPAGSALAGKPASPATPPPLPAPDRARDIVVRAVAKLNVEMRKSGGTGLDTKTILRLQQLIRRELEKDGEKS